jgi:pyridoxal 5'-phosphate synthase pdxS subunit
VGSGIFKSDSPPKFARAIVKAVANFEDPKIVADACRSLEGGSAMKGIDINTLAAGDRLAERGV